MTVDVQQLKQRQVYVKEVQLVAREKIQGRPRKSDGEGMRLSPVAGAVREEAGQSVS